jgi:hypothetical protein
LFKPSPQAVEGENMIRSSDAAKIISTRYEGESPPFGVCFTLGASRIPEAVASSREAVQCWLDHTSTA